MVFRAPQAWVWAWYRLRGACAHRDRQPKPWRWPSPQARRPPKAWVHRFLNLIPWCSNACRYVAMLCGLRKLMGSKISGLVGNFIANFTRPFIWSPHGNHPTRSSTNGQCNSCPGHGRCSTSQFGSPRRADGHGRHGRGFVGRALATQPEKPALGQPRPLCFVQWPRLDDHLCIAAPHRLSLAHD